MCRNDPIIVCRAETAQETNERAEKRVHNARQALICSVVWLGTFVVDLAAPWPDICWNMAGIFTGCLEVWH